MPPPRPDWSAQVHPELQPFLRWLPSWTFGPFNTALLRCVERLVPSPPVPATVTHRVVATTTGPLHLYAPAEGPRAEAAVLLLHGGGLLIGDPRYNTPQILRLVQRLGVVVAAATYRKAPKHPFPAALDDCHAAWTWLVDHARSLGIAPERIVVLGESAGGGLAASLTQRLHDEGGVQPAGQALVYPMLDDRTAARTDLTALRHLVWTNGSNHYGWASYLGAEPGASEVQPYAVPARRQDLTGLPPAWLTVGTLDLFHDEDLAYAERLQAAGVPAVVEVLDGAFHGVLHLGTRAAPVRQLWTSLERFLESRLAPPD